jgi:hypothetical protein
VQRRIAILRISVIHWPDLVTSVTIGIYTAIVFPATSPVAETCQMVHAMAFKVFIVRLGPSIGVRIVENFIIQHNKLHRVAVLHFFRRNCMPIVSAKPIATRPGVVRTHIVCMAVLHFVADFQVFVRLSAGWPTAESMAKGLRSADQPASFGSIGVLRCPILGIHHTSGTEPVSGSSYCMPKKKQGRAIHAPLTP